MDPQAVRRLGKSNVGVTAMGFGGAPLGDLFERVEDAAAEATLQAAWDTGLRHFDTAPWYGLGQSEHRLGRFLYRQDRESFVLSTKVGRVLKAPVRPERHRNPFWAGGLPFEHVFDYSYDGVMRSFEDSLQRLGMNRIDLAIIHDLDFRHHTCEASVAAYLAQLTTGGWRALEELRTTGVIRGIGCGINETGMIPRFLEAFDIDFFLLAMRYTLMEQDTLDTELPACAARDVGIVIGGVFSSGITATGAISGAKYNYEDAPPEVMAKVRRIEEVCRDHAVPLPAAALQFPFGHPSVTSVIPGGFAPAHVEANIAHLRHPIPAAFWHELARQGLVRQDAPLPGAAA
ncbi:MAG: aldo/keto reductase [Geminicoccaceae bacterium]|nr:aldo/keto reductase [Geminicoccaceae bacterium]